MQFNRCLGCMEEIQGYPCPHCGFDPQKAPASNYVLPSGTVLAGHYVVGRVLGQGGFGITYIGYDLNLERKVAIKEYFPSGQVSRFSTMGTSLVWRDGEQAEALRVSGMDSFLREARKMAKMEEIPEVVRVRESFRENNTAYIVMDYIEGKTLLSVLKEKGPMPWEQARDIFLPAISAMEQVHREGLVHRDLSPDNLMLTAKGVRILDLGAAKDLSSGSGASSAQVAKSGFSPFEQYTQRGASGPWSDVYAMAATIYYTLTGVLPPNANDRMEEDTLDWTLLTKRGVPANVISALQKAMTVSAKGRTQSMAEFLQQLSTEKQSSFFRRTRKNQATDSLPSTNIRSLERLRDISVVSPKRKIFRISKRFVIAIGICVVMSILTMVGLYSFGRRLEGVWIRQPDDNTDAKGMVVVVSKVDGIYQGEIIEMGNDSRLFEVGQIKWKNIRKVGFGQYECNDLIGEADTQRYYYDESLSYIKVLNGGEHLTLVARSDTTSSGRYQIWIKQK